MYKYFYYYYYSYYYKTGEADEMNLEVDSKDSVMHIFSEEMNDWWAGEGDSR